MSRSIDFREEALERWKKIAEQNIRWVNHLSISLYEIRQRYEWLMPVFSAFGDHDAFERAHKLKSDLASLHLETGLFIWTPEPPENRAKAPQTAPTPENATATP